MVQKSVSRCGIPGRLVGSDMDQEERMARLQHWDSAEESSKKAQGYLDAAVEKMNEVLK